VIISGTAKKYSFPLHNKYTVVFDGAQAIN